MGPPHPAAGLAKRTEMESTVVATRSTDGSGQRCELRFHATGNWSYDRPCSGIDRANIFGSRRRSNKRRLMKEVIYESANVGDGSSRCRTVVAAGYAACFENALLRVSREARHYFSDDQLEVVAEIGLSRNEQGDFVLSASLAVTLVGVDQSTGEEFAHRAHQIFPYSTCFTSNSRPASSRCPRLGERFHGGLLSCGRRLRGSEQTVLRPFRDIEDLAYGTQLQSLEMPQFNTMRSRGVSLCRAHKICALTHRHSPDQRLTSRRRPRVSQRLRSSARLRLL